MLGPWSHMLELVLFIAAFMAAAVSGAAGFGGSLLLLPLAIALVIRMIPPDIWEECKKRAYIQLESGLPCIRTVGIVIVVMIWVAVLTAVTFMVWQLLRNGSIISSVQSAQ